MGTKSEGRFFEILQVTVGYLRRWLAYTFNLAQMFIATFANKYFLSVGIFSFLKLAHNVSQIAEGGALYH